MEQEKKEKKVVVTIEGTLNWDAKVHDGNNGQFCTFAIGDFSCMASKKIFDQAKELKARMRVCAKGFYKPKKEEIDGVWYSRYLNVTVFEINEMQNNFDKNSQFEQKKETEKDEPYYNDDDIPF